jgi:predicted methyltransferase
MTKLSRSLVLALLAPVAASCATTRSETPAAAAPGAPTPAVASPPADREAKLRAVLALPHRSEKNRARDQYRHPIETLSFFGVTETSNVLEIWPGGGWYTEVLAPFLNEKGHLAVTNTDSDGGKKYAAMLAEKPEIFGKVEQRIIAPPDKLDFGPPGSADVVLTFRNVHGWLPKNYDDKVYAAAFRVLKSGGVFGVVEHRAKPGSDPAELKDTGYVPEEFVIKRVEEAGFRLAEKSEVNANPKDTKDHPKGVWTLPPSLRLGDVDKDKYLSIGESDRMTLKFVKP